MEEDTKSQELNARMMRLHKFYNKQAIEDFQGVDVKEVTEALLAMRTGYQNCPKNMQPICESAEKEIALMLKKCKTVNEDIRSQCFPELREAGFSPFRRCTLVKTRIAETQLRESAQKLLRRLERIEKQSQI